MKPLRLLVLVAAGVGMVSGCASLTSSESVLNPAGPQAHRLASLYWLFLVVCIGVWVLVMVVLGLALRRAKITAEPPTIVENPSREKRLWIGVGSALTLTTVILFLLLIGEFSTARAFHRFGENVENQVSLQVTARQWWWEIQYKDAVASNWITTANEIVIPVGRKVAIELKSADVIHSFWVPALHGKKDVVPGHPSILWLQADRPGTYYGECAEYCGLQHAQMRLVVKAVNPSEFDAFLANSRSPAAEPKTASEKRGRDVFLSSTCVSCHQINGLHAFGRVGPNLTHVGSRSIIAGGALENSRGNLAGWLADPQRIKPGSRMPQTLLDPTDLQALTDYLQSLK